MMDVISVEKRIQLEGSIEQGMLPDYHRSRDLGNAPKTYNITDF